VPCKLSDPVKEFTVLVVFAASLTAASAFTDAWADDAPFAAPELELAPFPEPELELAAQPAAAIATIAASPAAYNGGRMARTCIKTSKA